MLKRLTETLRLRKRKRLIAHRRLCSLSPPCFGNRVQNFANRPMMMKMRKSPFMARGRTKCSSGFPSRVSLAENVFFQPYLSGNNTSGPRIETCRFLPACSKSLSLATQNNFRQRVLRNPVQRLAGLPIRHGGRFYPRHFFGAKHSSFQCSRTSQSPERTPRSQNQSRRFSTSQ